MDLLVADEGQRIYGNTRRSSNMYHPVAYQSGQHIAYLEHSPHDTHLWEGLVSDTQNAQGSIHGFFADQTSAYPLMAFMPFHSHQGPLYFGGTQHNQAYSFAAKRAAIFGRVAENDCI